MALKYQKGKGEVKDSIKNSVYSINQVVVVETLGSSFSALQMRTLLLM